MNWAITGRHRPASGWELLARRANIPAFSLGLSGLLFLPGAIASPSTSGPDPFAFFRPDVEMSADQRTELERGRPVVSVLESSGCELAVFTAIQLDDDVTADRAVAWMRNIPEFRKSRYVLHARQFSTEPRLEDLDTLLLDEADLKDLEDCRPGDCGLKLSAGEMERLHRVRRAAGREWRPALQTAFRELLLHRVVRYRRNGHGGLDEYHDESQPRSPRAAFSQLLQHSTFLLGHAPVIAETLTGERLPPEGGVEELIYWSKEQLGGKAVVSATHVRIFRPSTLAGVDVLMTSTQIFATHYLDASLGVTAIVRDRRTSRGYLVYVNRSEVDLFRGFWGRVARRIVKGRIREEGPALVRGTADRLASGDPPPPVQPLQDSDRR